jgi:hypothetical protein
VINRWQHSCIKITNREANGYLTNGRIKKGWGKDLSKYICSRRHKYKEDSINECNKRSCLWWKDVKRVGQWCFSKKHSIKKVLADRCYDSKDNFGYLDILNIYIVPVNKVRKNSSGKNNTIYRDVFHENYQSYTAATWRYKVMEEKRQGCSIDGWPNLHSHLSKECLVIICIFCKVEQYRKWTDVKCIDL